MNIPFLRQLTASLILSVACLATVAASAQERPNVVIILSDDMGYSDAGCFGSEIHTPNLDKLAMSGAGSFYDPSTLCRDTDFIETDSDNFYYTDKIGKEAVSQIERFSATDKPFFQYVAFTAPHWPLHAPEESVQKYIATYRSGWEKLRRDRYARMLRMGIITEEHCKLPDMEPEAQTGKTGTIKAGSESDKITSTLDILPTIAYYAGIPLREDRVYDGYNLVNLLSGASDESPRNEMYYYTAKQETIDGIRVGNWKLL